MASVAMRNWPGIFLIPQAHLFFFFYFSQEYTLVTMFGVGSPGVLGVKYMGHL